MFNIIKSRPHTSDLQTKAFQGYYFEHKEIVEFRNISFINCLLVTVRLLTKRKLIIAVCYKETENLKYCYENIVTRFYNFLIFEVVTLKSLGLEVTGMRT